MGKNKKKIIAAFVAMFCVAAAAVGIFYFVINRTDDTDNARGDSASEVVKLIDKDLDTKYPGTPTEVVKLYWRINKCIYNNSLEDEEFESLLKQLRKLYDEEFLAKDENQWDTMLKNFKADVENYRDNSRIISIYTVDSSSSAEYGEVEGKECATLISSVMIKEKSKRMKTFEKFMCRKNDDGKWKILGWEQADSEDQEPTEE